MKRAQNSICPRCGGPVPNEENKGMYPGALSRRDNETEICSRCGTEEAMEDLARLLGGEEDHVILVAFHVNARNYAEAEDTLTRALPRPDDRIVEWWVAEDRRNDGSDNDSAVFVFPGLQHEATKLLFAAGLTPRFNVVNPVKETR